MSRKRPANGKHQPAVGGGRAAPEFKAQPSGDVVSSDVTGAAKLRTQAEAVLGEGSAPAPEDLAPETSRARMHELQVHQIELEMQSGELRGAQLALDASRARYYDLFDLAPVGYVTLSEAGLILEANLAFADLLGVTRGSLAAQPFSRYIHPADQDSFYQLRRQARAASVTDTPDAETPSGSLSCQLRVMRGDRTPVWAQIVVTTVTDDDEGGRLRVAVSDISALKQGDAELRLMESIALGIGEAATLDDALRLVLQRICETSGWATGEAWLPNREGNLLECHPAWYTSAPNVGEFRELCKLCTFAPGEGLVGSAWTSGKPRWVTDVQTTADFKRAEAARRCGLRAACAVPVLAHGEVVLVLCFFLFEPGDEDLRQVQLISAVAANIGSLIERKQAEERSEYLTRLYATLSQVNKSIVRIKDQDELYQTICRAAVEEGHFTLSWIGMFDEATGVVTPVAAFGAPMAMLEAFDINVYRPPFSNGVLGRALLSGGVAYSHDVQTDAVMQYSRDAAARLGLHGAASVPIRRGGEIAGVLSLYSSEVGLFDDAMLQGLLGEMASDISFALDTMDSEARRRRAETEVDLLQAIVRGMGEADDLGSALSFALQRVCEATGWDVGEAWFPNRDGTHLEPHPVWYGGVPGAELFREVSQTFSFAPGEGVPGAVWQAREPVWIEDVSSSSEFPRSRAAQLAGLKAAVGVPVLARGEVVAVLDFFLTERRTMDRHHVELIAAVAAQIGWLVERKQADENLAASERFFRALLENASDMITVVNREGEVLFAGPSNERVLGRPPEEVVGHSATEWLHPSDAPRVALALRRAVTNPGTPELVEYQIRHANGGWRIIESIGRSMAGGAGEGLIVVNSRDVTEKREIDERLRRSQKMEAIGHLAGGVAHDLNNALAPIMMSAELLRLRFPEMGGRYLDLIQGGAKRGADMVKHLLAFAKGAEGERVLLQPLYLLSEMENLIRSTFPKNIDQRFRLANDLHVILGDATQLHQVLLNLCVNARDAMPNGGTLTLAAENVEMGEDEARSNPEALPGRYVRWQVSDTGAGIPASVLDRIFDPFFTTKGPDKGTGLGLSTVLGIISDHDGFIRVTSEQGRGSTFSVFLPAADTESAEYSLAAEHGGLAFRGAGELVLVVDDEASNLEVMRDVLTAQNFRVLTAADGAAAQVVVADHRTELCAVITDLHMPGVDGLALARVLKATLPEVGIVVVSGRMDEQEEAGFYELGVTTLLGKPFTPEQLVTALGSVLQR